MRKRVPPLCLALLLLASALGSCAPAAPARHERESFDWFDTHTRLLVYGGTETEFDALYALVSEELGRLHSLFDIYHSYDGLNNLYTVNERAGGEAVAVHADILALLRLYQEACAATDGALNAALGPVLALWHEARESGLVPDGEALRLAAGKTDAAKLVLDEEAGTAFLQETGMRLDVGAIAKGWAAQKCAEAARAAGYTNFLLDMGGNIIASGIPPLRGRTGWTVGIQNPFDPNGALFDSLMVTDMAVVTSGTYQRYFEADGKRYHHIIDADTLYPAERYEAVSIIHENAATADLLSTALFILSEDEGRELLERYGGHALWLYPDGTSVSGDGYGQWRTDD